MAPKLPPPANTKAVFAGLAWFNTDKETLAPATRVGGARGVLAGFVAGDRGVYHSLHRRPRERVANAGTHNHRCVLLPRVAATAIAKHKAVAMGPGSRLKAGTTKDKLAALACPGRRALSARRTPSRSRNGRAGAHHDPIALDIERRLADIVEQLL